MDNIRELVIKDSNGNEYELVKKKKIKTFYVNVYCGERESVYTGVTHYSEESAKSVIPEDKYYVKTIKFEAEV